MRKLINSNRLGTKNNFDLTIDTTNIDEYRRGTWGVGAGPGYKTCTATISSHPSQCRQQRVPYPLNHTCWCFHMTTHPWRLPCSATEPRWGSCPCSMGCHVREGSSPSPLLGHSRRPAVSVGLYPHSMSATWHLLHPHVPLQLLGRERERHAQVSNRTIFNSIRSLFFFFSFFSNLVYDLNKKLRFISIHHICNQMKILHVVWNLQYFGAVM